MPEPNHRLQGAQAAQMESQYHQEEEKQGKFKRFWNSIYKKVCGGNNTVTVSEQDRNKPKPMSNPNAGAAQMQAMHESRNSSQE